MIDFRSLVIGFLMCTCMFLFIGADSTNWIWSESQQRYIPEDPDDLGRRVWESGSVSQLGRYQISNNLNQISMVDTQTGDVYIYSNFGNGYNEKWEWAEIKKNPYIR